MLPRGLLKEYSTFLSMVLFALDTFGVFCAGLMAFYLKFHHLELKQTYWVALCSGMIISGIIFQIFKFYQSKRGVSLLEQAQYLIHALLIIFIFLAGLAFLTKTGTDFSRIWFGLWSVFSFTWLFCARVLILKVFKIMRKQGWNEKRVIIVGAGDLGIKLAETVQQALWTGFKILAILDDHHHGNKIAGLTVLKTPQPLSQFLEASTETIDEVWLTLPLTAEHRVKEIMHELRFNTVTTRYVLDIFGLDLLNHSITNLAGFPVLNIRSTPMQGINRVLKAIEDRVLAFLILLMISPLFLLITVLVKLSSPGPVFYKQKRVGWNGKEFEILKFRSMPIDVENQSGPVWAKQNEKRATKIGAILRKFSLDELPQFINVLRGDMSIVGPRPERLVFVEEFKTQIPRYMQKHLVKAGITGWAQINGWRGNTSLEKRIEYDLFYIENWSLLFDIKIIFMTFLKGFINKNAY